MFDLSNGWFFVGCCFALMFSGFSFGFCLCNWLAQREIDALRRALAEGPQDA